LERGPGAKEDVVLAADIRVGPDTTIRQMLVENDTAYFAMTHGIASWKRNAPAPTMVTESGGDRAVKRIALDDTHVYFPEGDCRGPVNPQSGACTSLCVIARVPKAGGKVEELTAVPMETVCEFPMLAVDETSVWFTPGEMEEAFSVPKAGGKNARKTVFS